MNFGYKYKGASKERLLLSVGTTIVPYTSPTRTESVQSRWFIWYLVQVQSGESKFIFHRYSWNMFYLEVAKIRVWYPARRGLKTTHQLPVVKGEIKLRKFYMKASIQARYRTLLVCRCIRVKPTLPFIPADSLTGKLRRASGNVGSIPMKRLG